MVAERTLARTGPKTDAGLARCRVARLVHGYYSLQARALRQANRELRRVQVAAHEAVRLGREDAQELMAAVGPKVLALATVVGGDDTDGIAHA